MPTLAYKTKPETGTWLRRPTLSAWASNLLVRGQPDAVAGLLRLGEGLREAHQELDPEQLRELSSQQHRLIGALARQTRQLAADAGHPVSEEVQREIEVTLHAVLADPQAAQEWASGRLVKPLTPPVGFTAAALSGAPQRAASAPPSALSGRPAAGQDAVAGRDRSAKEQRREAERQQKVAEARQDAERAGRQAREREAELRQAESAQEQAEKQLQDAEERSAALAEEVKAAQEQKRQALSALDQARRGLSDAVRKAREARSGAETARARAKRIEDAK